MLRLRIVATLVLCVSAAVANGATVQVHVGPSFSLTFSPATVTIAPGDTVQWTWDSGLHNVTSTTAEVFMSPNQTAGTFSYTFANVGQFPYVCTIHYPTFPMSGTVIVKGDTTTALTTSQDTTTYAEAATLTATVTANAPATGTPTGTVTFMDGATPFCSNVALNAAGAATCSTAPLSAGAHSITATYNGVPTFNPSTSQPIAQTVVQASSTTALSSLQNPSDFGQSVTFKATVTIDAPGTGSPDGVVTFSDGAFGICAGVHLSSGVASCTTSTLAIGNHNVTAAFDGDANVSGSSSATVIQTVRPGAPQNFVATATSDSDISLGWTAVTGAVSYDIYRGDHNAPPTYKFSVTDPTASETYPAVSSDTTYVYRIKAVGADSVSSAFSAIDLATTVTFAANPPQSGVTVQGFHMNRVRAAARAMLRAAGIMVPVALTAVNDVAIDGPILGQTVRDMQSAMQQSRTSLGYAPPSFTPISDGATTISAAQLLEIYVLSQ
jgi:plastocyanin